jgi:protein involved in polysaccharide export with SLBB domain
LRDVARRAGGFTQRAYLYGSEFTRESNRLMQQQRLDEYVRSVRMEADRGTQALAISGGLSANTASDVSSSRAVTQELLSRLSQIRATGRIVLQFRARAALLEDVPAISLENGDKFVVPYAPATVNVVGAVYDQNSFLYQSGRSVSHYLQLAGGPNRNADRRHAFVIRADGSVVSRAIEQGSSLWSNSFERIRLNPGDTIVVPDKTLRPNTLRGLLDWTQVFSQLALGSAAINILR